MAITGISIAETSEFILPFDSAKTKDEGATVFILGSLDAYQRAELNDSVVRMVQTEAGMELIPNRNSAALRAARYGIRGWENFKDEKGNDIKFESVTEIKNNKSYTIAKASCLEKLPATALIAIGEEVMRLNTVGMQQAGN